MESQTHRKFPEVLSHHPDVPMPFSDITVLATGNGEKWPVSLWEQNGQKKHLSSTFWESSTAGKAFGDESIQFRTPPSSLSPGHCPVSRALGESLLSFRADKTGFLIFISRPVPLLASQPMYSSSRCRCFIHPDTKGVLHDSCLTLTLICKPSVPSAGSASEAALQSVSICISYLVRQCCRITSSYGPPCTRH